LKYGYGNAMSAGNTLRRVSDSGTGRGFVDGNSVGDDYSYDSNGNMTSDKNKQIAAITYNYLNLPEKVTKNTGDFVGYTYDATGRRLIQDVYNATNILKREVTIEANVLRE